MFVAKLSWVWPGLTAAWLIAVGAGFWLLQDYKTAAGSAGAAPARWPDDSRLERPEAGYRAVLFLHPRCPCSRATLAELARIMARCGDRLTADVLFFRPQDPAEPWAETDLWRQATVLPGVRVRWDEGGAEARRFSVRTSGHVLLYDVAGRLRFSGGITPSRGHEGDSAGWDAVLALLRGDEPEAPVTAVFGCPLEDPGDPHEEPNP